MSRCAYDALQLPAKGNDMSNQYSLDALRDFLDWAADKGAIKRATALSWRTAVDKVFADPDGIDTNDLRNLGQSLEVMLTRFTNLHGKEYTSASLRTYQGRVRSAVTEFLRYADNPANYSPRIARRAGRASSAKNDDRQPQPVSGGASHINGDAASQGSVQRTAQAEGLTIPVPIREQTLVRIYGLPTDLTPTEAEKIANVVKAYATLDKK